MKNIKITVIVPVYNVENYLVHCINSLINQSHKNMEIILINDGSQDNSGKICDEYALLDNRIIVIHQKNMGVSAARNKGLNIMTGEYVAFLDSDDFADEDMYETLLGAALKYNADLVKSSYRTLDVNGNILMENPITFNLSTTKDEIFSEYVLNLNSAITDILFTKSIFDDLRFEENRTGEDVMLTPRIFNKAKICVRISYTGYNYVQTPISICRGPFSGKILTNLYVWINIYNYYNNNIPQYSSYAKKNICISAVNDYFLFLKNDVPYDKKNIDYLINIIKSISPKFVMNEIPSKQDYLKFIKDIFDQYNENVQDFSGNQFITKGDNLKCKIFSITPTGTIILLNIKRLFIKYLK